MASTLERLRRKLAPPSQQPTATPAAKRVSDKPSGASAAYRQDRLIDRLRRELKITESRVRLDPDVSGPAAKKLRPHDLMNTLPPARASPNASEKAPRQASYRREQWPGRQFGDIRLANVDTDWLERAAQLTDIDSPIDRTRIVFLDTETTGLSRGAGTLPFVIGLAGFWGPLGELTTEQWLLEDPGSEKLMLERVIERLASAQLLVTYNGAAFDLPILRNRALINRLRLPSDFTHLDLLPLCRRLFAQRLDTCRLVHIERHIMRYDRGHDLDGRFAQQVYIQFLKHGVRDGVEQIMTHNARDTAVLAALLQLVGLHYSDPLRWAEDGHELLALGRYHLRRDGDLAVSCLERAAEMISSDAARFRALVSLGKAYRKRNRELSRGVWERVRRDYPREPTGWVELAKYHEHVSKDLRAALALAEGAPHKECPDLAHRVARLKRRLGGG